jgi:hypothetical protein
MLRAEIRVLSASMTMKKVYIERNKYEEAGQPRSTAGNHRHVRRRCDLTDNGEYVENRTRSKTEGTTEAMHKV